MTRLMTFVLSAGPYSGQTAASVLKLAGATLDGGHRATIFATADGVSGFVKGQKVAGVFDVATAAERFLDHGGEVFL
jgi:sulfur relay (sulfurtransferase) complex TusBCD TusD component (DsrE family)